ncbi:MAG: hypothetical protein SH808_03655 [Saprospiraceae bacterium]|nr:hypothetical protein [Saprospiraceae bacterium]
MSKSMFFTLLFALAFFSCQKDETLRTLDQSYQPVITAANFPNSTTISNPYFPVAEGLVYSYEGQTPDGLETIEEQRLNITRTVQGIECLVVNFKAYLNGHLIEEADDWYAQDKDGHVWYFGEDVNNYNPDGTIKDHSGSWEAGIDGAKAGIIMQANPLIGTTYREEYYFNEAEDEAEIMATDLNITIPFGAFTDCLQSRNFTAIEPDLHEHKFYAPGIGLIKEINLADNSEIHLVSIH